MWGKSKITVRSEPPPQWALFHKSTALSNSVRRAEQELITCDLDYGARLQKSSTRN